MEGVTYIHMVLLSLPWNEALSCVFSWNEQMIWNEIGNPTCFNLKSKSDLLCKLCAMQHENPLNFTMVPLQMWSRTSTFSYGVVQIQECCAYGIARCRSMTSSGPPEKNGGKVIVPLSSNPDSHYRLWPQLLLYSKKSQRSAPKD